MLGLSSFARLSPSKPGLDQETDGWLIALGSVLKNRRRVHAVGALIPRFIAIGMAFGALSTLRLNGHGHIDLTHDAGSCSLIKDNARMKSARPGCFRHWLDVAWPFTIGLRLDSGEARRAGARLTISSRDPCSK
jgi:hypothetical protein